MESIRTLNQTVVSRASLSDEVTSTVREMVRNGTLRPGELYSVHQLAEALGVSRSPVRESLLKLAVAGLVTFERNRGFRVAVPEARDIAEIFAVRLALEPEAARRVATAPSVALVAELHDRLAALRRTVDDEATFWSEDRALHECILVAAGNLRVATIIDQLRETTRLIGTGTTRSKRSLRAIADDHAPLVNAICAGDPEKAGRDMEEHLVVTGRLLMATALSVSPDDPLVDEIWDEVVGAPGTA